MPQRPRKPQRPGYEEWREEARDQPEDATGGDRPWHAKVVTRDLPFFSIVLLGYGVATLVGFVLLMLPVSSASNAFTPPIDALFTAASSISDTGLVVVNTGAHWSFFGQMVILVLIQLGGLGLMIISSFLLLTAGKRVHLTDFRIEDAIGASSKGGLIKTAVRALIITAIFEAGGIFLLATRPAPGVAAGPDWWPSVFHAISAFNNAGFDVTTNAQGFSIFQRDAFTLMVLSGLVFFGSLSAPVIVEVAIRSIRGGFSLDTKLALTTTIGLLALGALGFWVLERTNAASMGGMGEPERMLNAFFISMSSRTAGFSTLNLGHLMQQSMLLIMILMFIGGVSGSTAGGIKVNTFAVMVLTSLAYLRGRNKVCAFQREVPENQVHKAVAVTSLSLLAILVVALTLSFTERFSFQQIAFETVSAFGTVGFSTGITPDLTPAGKMLLSLSMFIGRLGPLTVALALAREEPRPVRYAEEKVRVG